MKIVIELSDAKVEGANEETISLILADALHLYEGLRQSCKRVATNDGRMDKAALHESKGALAEALRQGCLNSLSLVRG